MTKADSRLVEAARDGNVVILAGAGVSAGPPASLPGWKPLNQAIARALRERVEEGTRRVGWLANVEVQLNAARELEHFPPDYQAQILEEITGERYFHALQALDVDERAMTTAHDAVAVLAAAGAVRAIVTTNFDRLIEQALAAHGVEAAVAYDDQGYDAMAAAPRPPHPSVVPVIKVHGCVSSHRSMIDTLKQRMKGRSRSVEACLEPFHSAYWVYAGFSAADLEGNAAYLGLKVAAERSGGGTYIAFPGSPELREGAKTLVAALGDRGVVVVDDVGSFLGSLCTELSVAGPRKIDASLALGPELVGQSLRRWAHSLPVAAAGLCLAAMFEAVGDAESAARILDRLVRKELLDERETDDFHALQLHYGRLGAVWGRFFAVPDLGGAESNASAESVQSLARIQHTEFGFAASSWLTLFFLWLNRGEVAMRMSFDLMDGVIEGKWPGRVPRSEEEVVDAWLSASQVMLVNTDVEVSKAVLQTAGSVIARARSAGDVVRVARVEALGLLSLAEAGGDVGRGDRECEGDFAQVRRVGDGFALGMRSLALGRWWVKKCAAGTSRAESARAALGHLSTALETFSRQGLDAWTPYVLVQMAHSYATLGEFEQTQAILNDARGAAERFPIWRSHVIWAVGAAKELAGDPSSRDSFVAAAEAAKESGLLYRHRLLVGALEPPEQ